jgi:DNA polymerase III epsilon subunit family exonuclease
MVPFSNLISDSLLINETIKLLLASGGSASAIDVVDSVMKIKKPDIKWAKMLVTGMVEDDPRLALNDDIVKLIPLKHDSISLTETDYVVFDFETTGAKCPPSRVTEIGAYRIEKGKIAGEFQTLINPESPIPPFITDLTNISDAMVADAPKFGEIAGDFLDFIGDAVLVAHNSQFDMKFLDHELGRVFQGYRIANPSLCTVQLSRKLVPNIENHKLKTVAEHFCVDLTNHHRAACDANATAKIFIELLTKLEEKGVNDLAGARKLNSSQKNLRL